RFGLLSACYGGGMIAGPAMGGLFGAISPHLPFLLAALLSASNLALTFILLRETRPDSPARSASLAQHRGRPGLSAVPGITFLLVAFGLVQFIGQAPGATWVLFTEHRLDWSPVEVGISLSVFGIVQVLVQALLTGRIVEWIGEAKTVIIGCVTDALGLVGLAIVTDAFSMAPILAALGIGGIGLPALQTLLSQRVDEQHQGRLQGVLARINSITSIFGPVAFTTIFALTYINADGFLWLCAAALYVPCVILIMRGTAASPVCGSGASGDSMRVVRREQEQHGGDTASPWPTSETPPPGNSASSTKDRSAGSLIDPSKCACRSRRKAGRIGSSHSTMSLHGSASTETWL